MFVRIFALIGICSIIRHGVRQFVAVQLFISEQQNMRDSQENQIKTRRKI